MITITWPRGACCSRVRALRFDLDDGDLVLEPARAAMKEALGQNPMARIQYIYPDGVDHLHVEALA